MVEDLTGFLAEQLEAVAGIAGEKVSLRWGTISAVNPVSVILDGQSAALTSIDVVGSPVQGQRVPVLLAARRALVLASGSAAAVQKSPAVPVGTVIDYAGAWAPEDYLLCDGATYPVVQYPQLAQVLGGRYRFGDMFRVPDLRGRVSVMADGSGEFSSVGQTGGEKNHKITIAEMPAHSHAGNWRAYHDVQKRNGRQEFLALNQDRGRWVGTMANEALTAADTETQQTGGSQSMSLLQPYYTVQKIIRAK